MSYGFVPIAAKKPGAADTAVQIFPPGSEEASDLKKIIFKEVNKDRYPPSKVVEKVQAAGFPKFQIHHHTQLWKKRDAKKAHKGYGCAGDYKNWVWFDLWVQEVLAHCCEEGERYR